ncbi:hypothetical protein HK098_004028 [Nowakowskiella sp. JEL0407]|nr:hypothetical protein HK098_004028 [Nowakowskiella sp. JEL0407]
MLSYLFRQTLHKPALFRVPVSPRNSLKLRGNATTAERSSEPSVSLLKGYRTLLIFTVVGGGAFLWYWNRISRYSPVVRQQLRFALKNQNSNDPELQKQAVEHYLAAILECIKEGKLETDNEVTGIMYKLGDLYDNMGLTEDAILLYTRAFEPYENPKDWFKHSGETKLRAVGVANKIADLYTKAGDLVNAQHYSEWSVKVMLDTDSSDRQAQPTKPSEKLVPASWATLRDLGSSIEALAGVYLKQKKSNLAMVLFLRALQITEQQKESLGFFSRTSSKDQNLCRRAIISNNVAECLVDGGNVGEAMKWASKANEYASKTIDPDICSDCRFTSLINMGTIAEMKSDFKQAKANYSKAIDLSTNTAEQNTSAREKLSKLL